MQHVIVRADDLQGKKIVEKEPIKLNKNHENEIISLGEGQATYSLFSP